MRQVKPMQHVGDGGQRLHHDPAGPKGCLDLTKRDPPAWRNTMARRTSACASRRGRRAPPILAGAVLPVRRTRCISLMAADALTAKRRAACRIELPPSTARTIRSRKSWDKGAVMINSITLAPDTRESDLLIPCKTEPL